MQAEPLRLLGGAVWSVTTGADAQYKNYLVQGETQDTLVVSRIGFDDGVERVLCADATCAHDSAACSAYLSTILHDENWRMPPVRLMADGEQLYIITEGDEWGRGGTVQVWSADGRTRRTLPLVDGAVTQSLSSADCFATDGAWLYYVLHRYTDRAYGTHTLHALHLQTGAQRVLQRFENCYLALADCDGDKLMLLQGDFIPDYIFSEEEDWDEQTRERDAQLADRTRRLLAVDTQGSAPQTVLEWRAGDYETTYTRGGVQYGVRSADGAVTVQPYAAGEPERVLCTTLPQLGSSSIEGIVNETLLVSRSSVAQEGVGEDVFRRDAVDLKTGSASPLTLSVVKYDTPRPVPILGLGEESLYVVMENRPVVRNLVGTDGLPYTVDSYDTVDAIISAEDFLANMPNYRDVTLLPQPQ